VHLARRVRRAHQQLTAHAQVRKQGLVAVAQREPQVLAAALRNPEGPAAKARLEVDGAQPVSSYSAWMGDGHVRDAASGNPLLESPPHNFDLGQLGHL